MTKIQFAYNVFGQQNIDQNKIPQQTIDMWFQDWKNSNLTFNIWFNLLKTRA
jgi:hypothetical protein